MPGLSSVYHFQQPSENMRGQQKAALNNLLHRPEYEQLVFVDEIDFFWEVQNIPPTP